VNPLHPSRAEVWLVDLDPTRGHEQAGRRPAAVISADRFNHGPAGLVVILPMTTTNLGIPLNVEILPPEGGVRQRSFVKCEDVRSVAGERLVQRWGTLSNATMATIADRLRVLLEL
jgi:mRNA interferase MazF